MKLKSGEMICSKCHGEGEILHGKLELMDYVCPKCKGKGIVDWVENIMGVRGQLVSPGVYVKEVDCSLFINPEVNNE
jgi:RecJ-like exonuclease